MPLIFGLMLFGWLHTIMLTPTYSIICYWNGILNLYIFDLRLLSGTQVWHKMRD